MKWNKFLGALLCVLCLASCGTVQTNTPFSIRDTRLRLKMTMDDLIYLGESEISVEYVTYLGVFSKIRKINGEAYNPWQTRKLNIPTQGMALSGKGLDLAAYKVLEDYPDAVYFQVIFKRTETERLFLGSEKKITAKIRAYSLR